MGVLSAVLDVWLSTSKRYTNKGQCGNPTGEITDLVHPVVVFVGKGNVGIPVLITLLFFLCFFFNLDVCSVLLVYVYTRCMCCLSQLFKLY